MTVRPLELSRLRRENSTVVTAAGDLTLDGYPQLRDYLLKSAAEDPDGLIADISGLAIQDPALVSVFTLVAMRIGEWPAIPFAVVSTRTEHRDLLRRRTVDRFAAVHADTTAAEAGLDRPVRLRAQQEFARSPRSAAWARQFVTAKCAEWAVPHLRDDACLVVSELVENTIEHTTSAPRVRLDLRRAMFTIAVADDSLVPARLHEGLGLAERGLGLKAVAQIARAWGCSRVWSGGKIVWAVLATPAKPR
ncbi:ATP-binding protein [Amycolatopsis sp. FDAARGOS 1241]|nr:ATP-binding protein [Amycolatopsis sp. FDAARGOS 1241]QRP50909.1 ATP-binding protein [Amycolatopsis sp. FDAARGOS 1241]